jgi:hypothetical protein
MTRIPAALFFAALMLLGSAASAQPAPGIAQSTVPGAPYAGAPDRRAAAGNALGGTPANMSCEAMMAQVTTNIAGMRAGVQKNSAQREIDQARAAMGSNDEAGCKAHTQLALNDIR